MLAIFSRAEDSLELIMECILDVIEEFSVPVAIVIGAIIAWIGNYSVQKRVQANMRLFHNMTISNKGYMNSWNLPQSIGL